MSLTEELRNYASAFRRSVGEEAEKAVTGSIPAITEELFSLYEKNGNRLIYEGVYFGRRKMLAVLGLEAIAEQKENGSVQDDVQRKLEEVICDICAEKCWALPAHVQRSREGWEITVDLFASETAQTLSDLCDTLRDVLPQPVRQMIRENVERRILTPYFSSDFPYAWWENGDNNWNAVCAGSIGSACIHLLRDDKDRLFSCLERILHALTFYVKGFTDEGACVEGIGYFTYGMTYFVTFARELKEYTQGRVDLLRGDWDIFRAGGQDKRCRMACFQQKCYFADGRTVSFSDGDSRSRFSVGLTCALAMAFPEVALPDMRRAAGLCDDSCFRFAGLKMDLQLPEQYAALRSAGREEKKEAKEASFYPLPEAQWAVCNAKNGVGMACKGGNNGESHNHNDIGHFLYEKDGVFLLTDLGSGEYTREYFSEKRYETFCNNSFSHSVPVLSGEGQCAGAEYACSSFRAEREGGKAVIEMEIAGAYRSGLADSILRKLEFDLENGTLTVSDRFRLPVQSDGSGTTVTERLVTQIPPVAEGQKVYLEYHGVKAVVTIADPTDAAIVISEQEHSNHSGVTETVYTIDWTVPSDRSEFTVRSRE